MPENEQQTPTELKTCDDCGQTGIKKMGSHKRFCKGKANESLPNKIDIPQQAERNPIRISDICQYKPSDMYEFANVAWFQDKEKRYSKVPEFVGIFHTDTEDELPCYLVNLLDGTLLPPFLVPGFIGMFPLNTEWPEIEQPEQSNEKENQEPIQEEVIQKEPEKEAVKILPPDSPKPKASILSKLLRKKEKKAQITPETKDLLQELKNAATTT